MKILITENQFQNLKNNIGVWGCNLLPDYTDSREWCNSAKIKIKKKYDIIQEQIDKVGDFLRFDEDNSLKEKVKYYTEGDPYFDDNIKNLNTLEELVSPNCEMAKNSIDEFKKTLSKRFLFVDKIDEKITYNKLTKLNSNYSALAYLLTDFRQRKGLEGSTFESIFSKYFFGSGGIEESPFFNLIINFFSGKKEAVEIIKNVLNTITETEKLGSNTEQEAYKFLRNYFNEENVKIFSGDFSWPDFLGVDMIVNATDLNWGWIPVQIKTDYKSCRGNKRFCKNICIGKNKERKYNWEVMLYDGTKEIHRKSKDDEQNKINNFGYNIEN